MRHVSSVLGENFAGHVQGASLRRFRANDMENEMSEPQTLEVAVIPRGGSVVRAEDFMPLMTVEQAIGRKEQMNKFIIGVMKEGEDYGYMPGDSRKEKKKVLLKPGAEKLCSIFGLTPRYEAEQIIEDWTGKEHGGEALFYYRYKCQLSRGGTFMGEAVGSANSWEAKHRYRWLGVEQIPASIDLKTLVTRGGKQTLFTFSFAFDKRETSGQYGKPEKFWQMFEEAMANGTVRNVEKETSKGKRAGFEIDVDQTTYRAPNPDAADCVNTCQKMAQKRALVAAILIVTNCSDAFTQDLEDMPEGEAIDTGGHAHGTQEAADHVAQTKLNGGKISAELSGALAAIDKNHQSFALVCQNLLKRISTKHGAAGEQAYESLAMKFSEAYPQGTFNKEILKSFVKDAHAIYDKPAAKGDSQVDTERNQEQQLHGGESKS